MPRTGTPVEPGRREGRAPSWRTRHPLLLGVVAILFGEAVFFSSLVLLAYALAYWLCLTAFVALKEEPDLRRTFGPSYDAYCREVPRWIPKLSRADDLPGGRDSRILPG